MNDRFRFRAWQKNYQKMYYDVEMTYDYPCEPRGAEQSSFGDVLENDDYVLMQCTGLKDKNGKLIYEGDIVAVILANGELEDIGCVKYGYFNCSCCDGVYGWGFGDADIRNYDRYTIVGNIHENPEMIDENNRD